MRSEAPDKPGSPQRHPDDGWTLARPMSVSGMTRRMISRFVDAMIPIEPRIETTVDDITRHILVSLQYMPRSTARGFILGWHLLNWSTLWRLRGLRPLSRLDAASLRKRLKEVATSRSLPIRLLLLAPQGLVMSIYFDQDYVHRVIDYEPIGFSKERIALRNAWVAGEEPDASTEIHHRLDILP